MFAVVYAPNFGLQAVLRREPELRSAPVALVDAEVSKAVIVQFNAAAAASGVEKGLTPIQAMARCDRLIIKPRSHVQEQATTEVLLQTAYAFSPNIESTALGVCTLELKGLQLQTQDAIEAWTSKIITALTQLDLEAKVGVAPTPALAVIAAHSNSIVRETAEFIEALPIQTLQPSPQILDILSRWGIRTVGAFVKLGKEQVAERLGADALDLFESVSVHSIRPLNLVSPSEEFSEQMEFDHEIETTEPLLFVLRRFVEQLSLRIGLLHRVIAELQMELGLSSGAKYQHTFKVPSPTGNITTLFRMLHTHLETLRTDSTIISVRLAANPCLPEKHQFGLFEATLRDPNQFAETLARLTALCGPDRVGTPLLEATHRPDSFRIQVPDFSQSTQRSPTQSIGLQLRRYRPALTASIEFRDQKPLSVHSRTINAAVTDVRGPFHSSGNWWDDNRWAREEWDVQTADGALYRIFRSHEGCFVEGRYD
ncbi:MAG TPA: DNA polymerase Y family protein [Verrucomicrobiae bacterium]|nr:DNA polymerase Y family protein [Verrucomicrobiae bacterium]